MTFKKLTIQASIIFTIISYTNTVSNTSSKINKVFSDTENPDLVPNETNYHRSLLTSEIRLVTAVSQENNKALITKATPQCATWAKNHNFSRHYVTVEVNNNGKILKLFDAKIYLNFS